MTDAELIKAALGHMGFYISNTRDFYENGELTDDNIRSVIGEVLDEIYGVGTSDCLENMTVEDILKEYPHSVIIDEDYRYYMFGEYTPMLLMEELYGFYDNAIRSDVFNALIDTKASFECPIDYSSTYSEFAEWGEQLKTSGNAQAREFYQTYEKVFRMEKLLAEGLPNVSIDDILYVPDTVKEKSNTQKAERAD